jgi:hypothetical protein
VKVLEANLHLEVMVSDFCRLGTFHSQLLLGISLFFIGIPLFVPSVLDNCIHLTNIFIGIVELFANK